MRFRDRFGLMRSRRQSRTRFDREATNSDLQALIAFAKEKRGVEFYVEPETFATDTTAMAVAHDGEWMRRRVGSPAVINKIARELKLPIYDVQIMGYPARYREWNARNRGQRDSL